MKKQIKYKIIFNDNNENNSRIIFAISKLVFYLEKYYRNSEDIKVNFSSINYTEDSNNIYINGEIVLHVIMSSSISSNNFKNKLNSIIVEIKNYYKILEVLIKEVD